jgi:hypothetical protein
VLDNSLSLSQFDVGLQNHAFYLKLYSSPGSQFHCHQLINYLHFLKKMIKQEEANLELGSVVAFCLRP